jgi:sugar lactone lactonase YvrE
VVDIEVLAGERDELGECPLWDGRRNRLWWVDSHRALVRSLDPATGARRQWLLPAMIGSIALCESGLLLAAMVDEITLWDLTDDAAAMLVRRLARVEHATEGIRLNDGRVDRSGRFCVGSLVRGSGEPLAALYRLDTSGGLSVLDRGFRVANATCFSPDGRWMYFADSRAGTLWRYACDAATGAVGPRELFIDTAALGSGPDGATVDDQGRLWVALVMTGQLACFAPDGRLLQRLDLPVPYPTCPCFGGVGLDEIHITSIRDSGNLLRSDHPDAGAMVVVRGTGARGLPEVRFDDTRLAVDEGPQGPDERDGMVGQRSGGGTQ